MTFKLPETVDVPRSNALASCSVTLFPLVIATVLKLLPALFNVMSLAPAARVVMPVTLTFPDCVIAPPAITLIVPIAVSAGRVYTSIVVYEV